MPFAPMRSSAFSALAELELPAGRVVLYVVHPGEGREDFFGPAVCVSEPGTGVPDIFFWPRTLVAPEHTFTHY